MIWNHEVRDSLIKIENQKLYIEFCMELINKYYYF